MKKNRKHQNINIRLSEEEYQTLVNVRISSGISTSDMIRNSIPFFVDFYSKSIVKTDEERVCIILKHELLKKESEIKQREKAVAVIENKYNLLRSKLAAL